MSPRTPIPNLGLNNIYLSPRRKPYVLNPGNTYHFAAKSNQVEFLAGGYKYSIFKDCQGRHSIHVVPVEFSGRYPMMRGARISSGSNELYGIIIIKNNDAFEVRLKAEEASSASPSRPVEPPPPEVVRAGIRETMRDSQISIEMARVAAEDINIINYFELPNAERLQDGDILPGHEFVLGKTETYGRELEK
ncbi:MAG: hypothetical protein U9R38_03155 [Candidatus Margulisiibacteriota bacterium]|nr:hypothetical protein [Candidatus Margulisiibacteriota bacterium]